jgi:gamma-glutamyltranspeptidase/glutathione hydrolase
MFGLIQGKSNAIEPQKRMLRSMSPTIVTNNDSVRMVLGAAGGPRIITATLHNFLNMAAFEMPTQKANSGRAHTIYVNGKGIKYGAPDPRGNGVVTGH